MSIEVVYAITSANVALEAGGQVQVQKGEHWVAGDPLVAQYPHLFSPDARFGARYTSRPAEMDAPAVEQATAAPGERRSTSRARG